MLGWLRNLFSRGDDRLLFRYWDGVKQRAIDPVGAYRRVWNDDQCNLLSDATTARNPPGPEGTAFYPFSEVIAAEDRLRELTRRVFDVKEWTESQPGLTLDETDLLLNNFLSFCADLKKKRSTSPTALPPTTSTEPCKSTDTQAFPAGSDQDYCSTANASNVAAPTGP
jgi:hypothetical protein